VTEIQGQQFNAIRSLFHPDSVVSVDASPASANRAVSVELLSGNDAEPRELRPADLPHLVLPFGHEESAGLAPVAPVIVASEGADARMGVEVRRLLNPERVEIHVIHVTWLTGIVTSPLPAAGLDNPRASDLLLYRGAREALVDTADQLRLARFRVVTHLRENRSPAQEVAELARELRPALVVLGLGRHGAGIGAELLRDAGLPVLFVRARG
jgi:nucleotide-binding universal stress UspA family protein